MLRLYPSDVICITFDIARKCSSDVARTTVPSAKRRIVGRSVAHFPAQCSASPIRMGAHSLRAVTENRIGYYYANGHYVVHADSTGPYVDIRHRSRIVGTCCKRNKLKRTRIYNGRLTGTEIRYVIPRVMRSIRFLNGPAKREVCLKAVLLDYFTLPGTFDIFRENTSSKWRFAFPLQREGKENSNYICRRKVFRRNMTETAYLFNFNFPTNICTERLCFCQYSVSKTKYSILH